MSFGKAFVSFLSKFADEYHQVGSALGTIALGVALDPKDREHVQSAVDTVTKAAASIQDSLAHVAQLQDNGVTHDQLKSALAQTAQETIPSLVASLVAQEVAKLLPAPSPALTAPTEPASDPTQQG